MSYDTTAKYDLFLPELLQYVPDVPESVAINALRNACIEFCEKTRYWQMDADSMKASNNIGEYEIDISAGMKFVDVFFGYYNQRLLVPKAADELDRIYRWNDWRSLKGEPAYITRLNALEIQIVPKPETQGGFFRLRVCLAPTRNSTAVGVDVYENYLDTIVAGARARLYATPAQAYFDRAMAAEYERKFRSGVSEVRVLVNKSLTRSSPRVEFQRIV